MIKGDLETDHLFYSLLFHSIYQISNLPGPIRFSFLKE